MIPTDRDAHAYNGDMKTYTYISGCFCLWEKLENPETMQLFRVRGTGAGCPVGHTDDVELLIRVVKNPEPLQEPPC